MKAPRDPVRRAQTIEVIQVVFVRGEGTEADPIREVIVYYSTDGEFLAEFDPCAVKAAEAW